MKKSRKVLLVLIISLAVLFLTRNFILKNIITLGGSNALGVKVDVKKLVWNLSNSTINIKDLEIYNPKGFPAETLLNIGLINVEYKLIELFRREPRLQTVAMKIRETVIIKDKDRKLNVNELNLTKNAERGKKTPSAFPVHISLLKLDIGPVIFKDFSKGEQPIIKTFDAGSKTREFKNVKSANKLVALALFNSIRRTSIKGAKIYALAALLGPSGIPVGLTGVLIGKDHADGEYDLPFDQAYADTLNTLKTIGEDVVENKADGVIKARVSSYNVSISIKSLSESKVKITASARKMKIPKPNFAGGILYQISQEITRNQAVMKTEANKGISQEKLPIKIQKSL